MGRDKERKMGKRKREQEKAGRERERIYIN